MYIPGIVYIIEGYVFSSNDQGVNIFGCVWLSLYFINSNIISRHPIHPHVAIDMLSLPLYSKALLLVAFLPALRFANKYSGICCLIPMPDRVDQLLLCTQMYHKYPFFLITDSMEEKFSTTRACLQLLYHHNQYIRSICQTSDIQNNTHPHTTGATTKFGSKIVVLQGADMIHCGPSPETRHTAQQ